MYKDKSVLCLMLARGGSRGVPGKNIKSINGYPLIYYTIEAVKNCEYFDRILLSTDSLEIAEVANKYGIETPFMRPSELAGDNSNASDVIEHALKWVEKNDKKYDLVQYIFPTAPFRTADDIYNGFNELDKNCADMVLSVCETEHPMFWENSLPENNSMKNFVPRKYRNKNRQLLPKSYRLNGSIFLAKWDIFYYKKDWFEQNTFAYIMPRDRSIDIDTPYDFQLAEILMKEKNGKKHSTTFNF